MSRGPIISKRIRAPRTSIISKVLFDHCGSDAPAERITPPSVIFDFCSPFYIYFLFYRRVRKRKSLTFSSSSSPGWPTKSHSIRTASAVIFFTFSSSAGPTIYGWRFYPVYTRYVGYWLPHTKRGVILPPLYSSSFSIFLSFFHLSRCCP